MIRSIYLSQILVCPACFEPISIKGDDILCKSCGTVGNTRKGILNFDSPATTEEQPAFYNDAEYKEAIQKLEQLHRFHYDDNSLSRKLENYLKSELLKIVIDPQRPFFDIGCGMGTGFKQLGYPNEIVGIDISFNLLQTCKVNYPEADCVRCDINTPPFRQNSLRTVFSLATLEHVFFLERFLESIEKLLHRDGFFYVMIPTEGGLVWGILKLLSRYKFKFSGASKTLNINYNKFMEKEHCNKANTIDNILYKFFVFDLVKNIPLKVGGTNLNIVKLYRLRKRI